MYTKSISIIIPARDEERHLPACLKSIAEAKNKIKNTIEIIVVLNRCTDGTEQIAKQSGCRIVYCDAKNLSSIRNVGAFAANGELLITLDADSKMSVNALSNIVRVLGSGKYVGGGVWIVPERLSVGIFITALMILPTIIKYRVFCGMFFCEKKYFEAIGGFDESLASIEDIDFGVRLARYGKTIGKKYRNLFLTYIVTSCRKFDHLGDWYFVFRPRLLLSLLKGKNQKEADRIWYEFPRK